MVCVHCGYYTKVVNSREQKRSNSVWRRRKCENCGSVFTTLESADYPTTWTVKSRGAVRPFSRDKLLISIYTSCAHRKTALNDATGLCNTVINKLGDHIKEGSVSSDTIRGIVLVTLNRFDKTAATHYAAFHKD